MATGKTTRADELEPDDGGTDEQFGIQTTGRQIVTFVDDSSAGVKSGLAALKKRAGVSAVSHAADFKDRYSMEDAVSGEAHFLDELGIAVLTGDPDQMTAARGMTASADENVIVEPEFVNFAFQDEDLDDDLPAGGGADPGDVPDAPGAGRNLTGGPAAYLSGFRDAADHLARALGATGPGAAEPDVSDGDPSSRVSFIDTSASTYGLQAVGAISASTSGRGIKVAVLDTGMDLNHPDFGGRSIQSDSFIEGETVQDGNGHGTHCIGTACGPKRPGQGPRYGVAFDAEIFAGKVLSNGGRGGDLSILAGINWAVRNGCQIVSMSLGRRVRPGEPPQTNYQTAGRRALRAGTLIIAAAGNDSNRPFVTIPVSSPANATSIAAVGAVDRLLRIARFSNQGINPGGGEINLVGPGVDVHSSWPMPIRLRTISGTSMATPHVAGVAALVADESRRFRGLNLYRELRSRTRRLALPRAAVGNGLVQA